MGTYRLFLALCVAASHCGALVFGYDEGDIAVISFLLLSGFVMTLLIRKHYETPATIVRFYTDRAARLLPQFFFYTSLALGLLALTPLGGFHLPWMRFQQCGPGILATNFTLFANNFYWIFGNCQLIPASWSLGLEGFFYLSIPLILQAPANKVRMSLAALSFACFLCACFGKLEFDVWAYRLLPGNLFIFLAGSALARPSLYHRHLPKAVFVAAVLLLALSFGVESMRQTPRVREMLAGLIIGIPAVALLSRKQFGRLDEMLGNISYGVFLNHLMVLWVFIAVFDLNRRTPHAPLYFLGLLAVSIALSWLTFTLVERPLIAFRRSLRSPGTRPHTVQAEAG